MKEEYLTSLAKKTGRQLAFELVDLEGYPIDYKQINNVKKEVLENIENNKQYSLKERVWIKIGIKEYFAGYDGLLRDYFRDVV